MRSADDDAFQKALRDFIADAVHLDGYSFHAGWQAALAYARGERGPQTYGSLEEVGTTERGYTIFREVNEVGGHRYWSDEIGGGVCVWDTCLADAGTLRECLRIEESALPSPVTESSGCVTDKAEG